ncbi:2-dehydro-3-deoxygalactonokinase [Vreelandella populi]|uniref:2-dehydro-3-deoxygalactonokinase n=1 Tax=Vreelandella populi TaxID=2498858 RepID=A0A433LH85_9GAMM|nr:2-dehydro-3-deoxygalactonokinase [Halomonas populi]RUR40886.1 2-dehydro-3-deoxygalactonokinase [Halomonas populi]RUR49394.1 2-dehydro-3-deoxygalactonokinase [Halomonas populi]
MHTDTDALAPLAWIAVDWGSSNLRAWALDQRDQVIAETSSDKGMLSLKPDEYETELKRLVSPWLSDSDQIDVMVCGMAGARQGWLEAAYLPVPTALDKLSQGAVMPRLADNQLRVHLLPGLSQTRSAAHPFDVMRGEETQLAGLVAETSDFSGLACLPGTHAKWATLEAGTVMQFTTYLTGELYQLLANQSVLKHSVGNDDLNDPACRKAFITAVSEIYAAPETFSSRLFELRAQDLLDGRLPSGDARAAVLAARLSGLAIGLELTGACRMPAADGPVTLIGNQALCQRYHVALNSIGLQTRHLDGDIAVLAGLRLAHRALTA